MVNKIIELSLRNRYIVLVLTIGLLGWGIYNIQRNPVDAIPDLSENEVIVFTEWTGQSPQIMEDQVTYPLVSNLQGVPKVNDIRGTSMFGMSFVYVIFDDDVAFNEYKDKNFTVLSVSLDQPGKKEAWLNAIHKDGLTWNHVSDLKFWDNAVAKEYGIRAIPQNLLLDPSGKIIAKNIRGEELNKKLAEIFK
jgi:hypothetical protein